MGSYVVECFLEYGLIVSVGGVGLQTEFDSIDEARQVIRFVGLHDHL